jgi:SAM-dependent methyltransferase
VVNDSIGTSIPAREHGYALLNLGCGGASHPAFVNVDLVAGPGIIGHDLTQGIPFPNATFDLVYHSTMLSTMRPADALMLTRECRRVLKPGGVLRVVTEDLEQMCRVYLAKLDAACQGDRTSAADYEWMILELYDQATREFSGGEMARFVCRDPLPNEEFICSRVGEQGRGMISGARARSRAGQNRPRRTGREVLSGLRAKFRKLLLTALLGSRGVQAWELGRFRLTSGQVTYRMYDRFSLEQLFLNAGLSGVSVKTATESAFPFWATVNLDVSPRGQAARPHALIMEGTRAG